MSRGGSGGSEGFMGDVIDFVGDVLDFLGADAASAALDAIGDEVDKNAAYAAAEEVFYSALGSCGNEGQISIIDSVGPGAFRDAVDYGFENDGDVSGFLLDQADYPEAVEDILGEAEDEISAIVEAAMDN